MIPVGALVYPLDARGSRLRHAPCHVLRTWVDCYGRTWYALEGMRCNYEASQVEAVQRDIDLGSDLDSTNGAWTPGTAPDTAIRDSVSDVLCGSAVPAIRETRRRRRVVEQREQQERLL